MADLTSQPGGFIWYELMTPDADAAKVFYDAVIGWQIDPKPGGGGDMDYRMIRRSDGGMAGGVLTLTPPMLEGGGMPGWYGYVHSDDVDATARQFGQAGGSAHMGPLDMDGVGRMALLADPQGAPLYVLSPTPPEGAPDAQSDVFSADRPQHIRWNELNTSDPEAAIVFYTSLFGWRQEGEMPMGELGAYKFFHHGDAMIGAVMRKPDAMPACTWLYYIGVEDIDRAAQAVKDGGGQVIEAPMQIPGGEYSALCRDPHGVAFGLVGPRNGTAAV